MKAHIPFAALPITALPFALFSLMGCTPVFAPPPAFDGGFLSNADAGTPCEAAAECDDRDPCTFDRCSPEGRCRYTRPTLAYTESASASTAGVADVLAWHSSRLHVGLGEAGVETFRRAESGGGEEGPVTLTLTSQGQRRPGGHVNDVIETSGHVVIAAGEAGLAVYPNDADQPVATFATEDAAHSMSRVDDLLLVSAAARGVQIVNIADITNPSAEGRADTPGRATHHVRLGRRVWVADGLVGLSVLGYDDPRDQSLQPERAVNLEGRASRVVRRGNLLATVLGTAGLSLVDMDAAPRPAEIARLTFAHPVTDAAFVGDKTLLVAAGDAGLHAFDLTTQDAPEVLGKLDVPTPVQRIRVRDLEVASTHAGLGLRLGALNCVDPDAPVDDS